MSGLTRRRPTRPFHPGKSGPKLLLRRMLNALITLYIKRKSILHTQMILSYRDRKTSRFAQGEYVKEFSGFARQAEIRLDRLDTAARLKDLAALPGNRLELLTGDRKGQYSIRINDQWRICFEWPQGSPGPLHVEITDYH
jgi:proteic killer suppression protein